VTIVRALFIFKEYNEGVSKKYLIIFLVLLVLVLVGGSYYWKIKTQQKPVVTDTVVVTPVVVSPTESAQGANPYDKTNPFSNIKVNPFE
jgi:hypothetical protein